MNKRRLLRSWMLFEPENSIRESVDSFKSTGEYVLRGILQKADTLNQNGRIYPEAILRREVENYKKYIIEKRSTGEADHPESSVVSLQTTSHLITDIKMEGKIVYGTIKLLSTPMGLLLRSLVNDGVKLGISSRGVGSTEKEGDYHVVQDDFQLICWDMVSEPSTPGAFMLPEGKMRAFYGPGLELDDFGSIQTESSDPGQVVVKQQSNDLISDLLSFRKVH